MAFLTAIVFSFTHSFITIKQPPKRLVYIASIGFNARILYKMSMYFKKRPCDIKIYAQRVVVY